MTPKKLSVISGKGDTLSTEKKTVNALFFRKVACVR